MGKSAALCLHEFRLLGQRLTPWVEQEDAPIWAPSLRIRWRKATSPLLKWRHRCLIALTMMIRMMTIISRVHAASRACGHAAVAKTVLDCRDGAPRGPCVRHGSRSCVIRSWSRQVVRSRNGRISAECRRAAQRTVAAARPVCSRGFEARSCGLISTKCRTFCVRGTRTVSRRNSTLIG